MKKQIALALRAASPTASPNRRFVALADAELGRGGRMTRAIEKRSGAAPDWFEIGEAQPFHAAERGSAHEQQPRVVIGLSAVIVAVTEDGPYVVVTREAAARWRACRSARSIQPATARSNFRCAAG